MENSNIILKVCIHEEIHRITVPSRITYDDLIKRIQKHTSVKVQSAYWIDGEGDKISMSSQIDAEEMFNFLSSTKQNMIKIFINSSDESKQTEEKDEKPNEEVLSKFLDEEEKDAESESEADSDDSDDSDSETDSDDDDEKDEKDEKKSGDKKEKMIPVTPMMMMNDQVPPPQYQPPQSQTAFVDQTQTQTQQQETIFIHRKAYRKLLKKSKKMRIRQEMMNLFLLKLKSCGSFNETEYLNKIELLKSFGLENNLPLQVVIACQVTHPKRFNKKPICSKKIDPSVLKQLEAFEELGLPHGPRVAKILQKHKIMNDVSSFFPEEVINLAKHFENLGLPRFLVCKILMKKHFSRSFRRQQKKLYKQEWKCQKQIYKQERKQQKQLYKQEKKQLKQVRKEEKRGRFLHLHSQPQVTVVQPQMPVHHHDHHPHHGHHGHHHGHHGHRGAYAQMYTWQPNGQQPQQVQAQAQAQVNPPTYSGVHLDPLIL